MTAKALELLDDDPEGFFLMVEGGRIDHAGHNNWLEHNIYETLEFDRAVQEGILWAQGRTDTLILVTADHETGGLQVLPKAGGGTYQAGDFPDVTWSTTGHTGVPVPIYAWGPHGSAVHQRTLDNTEVFQIMAGAAPEPGTFVLFGFGTLLLWVYRGRIPQKRWGTKCGAK